MQDGYDQGPYSSRPHDRRHSNGGPPPHMRMMGGPPPMHMGGPPPPPGYFAVPPPHARRRSRSPDRGGPYRGGPGHSPYAPPPKLTDPFTIKELVTYEYFKRWYHTLNPGNLNSEEPTFRTRFDDYVADFNLRTAKDFVSEQQTFPWFEELYGGSNTDTEDLFEARFACTLVPANVQDAAYEAFDSKLTSGEYKKDAETDQTHATVFLDRPVLSAEHNSEPLPDVVFIKSIAPKIPRTDLQEFVAAQVPLEYLSMSRPNTKLLRNGLVKLKAGSDIDEAVKKLEGRILMSERVGEYALHVQAYRPFTSRLSLFPQHNVLTQSTKDLEALAELVKKFESATSRAPLWSRIEAGFDGDDAFSPEQKAAKTVDLAVEYLRSVYCFDYWTATFHDSPYSLAHNVRPCVRASESGESVDDRRFEAWRNQHAQKLSMLLQPLDYLHSIKVKPIEGALQDLITAKIKKEDETRFRCGIEDCAKLFKDVPFVEKHIHKRHATWVEAQKTHFRLLYRYLCDPGKLVLPKLGGAERESRRPGPPSHAERRRSPPDYRRDPGGYYDSPGGRGPPGPPRALYRDLDRPAEPVVELDY
ncbi:hypothetical protein BCR37DRAFT_379663 [Protomyces lactucae-debilis]|uniref:C2H2-type domain-containing protein n=1 Tax=Protomyces lactucae-debilis TaxID=2754530 RepID=A0A1Y2FHA7_PROLT|nr:uncharacterized protein BCR37DRAFT_379663 [Protomyces lactucae-debilis]ORY82646.1 hypothetical protein BCR37DRAFT_379663 [Protomyces lactucae-debilis]